MLLLSLVDFFRFDRRLVGQKYLLPHLRPPSTTAYEEDRDALTAQFDAAEALLKEIQADTSRVREAVDAQTARVDKVVKDVEDAVHEMREGEVKNRDEMREIRDEINTIRESLPKASRVRLARATGAVFFSSLTRVSPLPRDGDTDDRKEQGLAESISRRTATGAQVPQGTSYESRTRVSIITVAGSFGRETIHTVVATGRRQRQRQQLFGKQCHDYRSNRHQQYKQLKHCCAYAMRRQRILTNHLFAPKLEITFTAGRFRMSLSQLVFGYCM